MLAELLGESDVSVEDTLVTFLLHKLNLSTKGENVERIDLKTNFKAL